MDAGRAASVCPFELALMLAERTDVIVCDYNYVFDPQVYFRRFFLDADYSDAVLVVDEAHNLLARAMEYYSPRLRRRQVHEVGKNLRHLEPALAKDVRRWLGGIDDAFESLARRRGDEYSQLEEHGGENETRGASAKMFGGEHKFIVEAPRAHFEDLKSVFGKLLVRYQLDKATSGRAVPEDPVEEFFSEFGRYCAVLTMDGEEFSHVFDASPSQALEIVCKDPSRLLAERIGGFHSVVAMSATLAPIEFYRQMMGFDAARTETLSLASPFPRENRRIVVVPNVLTTFRARSANSGKIADVIAATARKIKQLRNHGSDVRYYHDVIGYNSRLDEMQAVILRAKLKRIDQYNQARRHVAHLYSELMADLPLITPYEDNVGEHVYHQYTLLSDRRDEILAALQAHQIGAAVYYPVPLHKQNVFKEECAGISLPVTESVSEHCFSLPICPFLEDDTIREIVSVIRGVLTA